MLCIFNSNFLLSQRLVTLTRKLEVRCPTIAFNTNVCSFNYLVPADRRGKQSIVSYSYSLKPNQVIKTATNEFYLSWKNIGVADLNKNDLAATIKIKIFMYDLNTAKKNPIIDKEDLDTLNYLKEEENLRISAKNIQEAAKTLKGNDREEIAKNIFNYVDEHLDYKIFFDQDRGAKKALKSGLGDCTEYSELMVTLCRAKKIPARIVMGLVIYTADTLERHNWVEVFFPQYGWVAFDPTWADGPNANTTFYKMLNNYIQLSYRRFFSELTVKCNVDGIPLTYKYIDTYKDELGNIKANKTTKLGNEMYTAYSNLENEKALKLIDSLIKSDPENALTWSLKGVVLARLNNFEKGLEALITAEKFISSKVEEYSIMFAYSNFYALKNDSEKSLESLKIAVELGFKKYDKIESDSDFTKLKDYKPLWDYLKTLNENPK